MKLCVECATAGVRPQVLAKFPDYPKIKKEILDKARQGLRS